MGIASGKFAQTLLLDESPRSILRVTSGDALHFQAKSHIRLNGHPREKTMLLEDHDRRRVGIRF